MKTSLKGYPVLTGMWEGEEQGHASKNKEHLNCKDNCANFKNIRNHLLGCPGPSCSIWALASCAEIEPAAPAVGAHSLRLDH